jgi:hypothetical protein
MNDHPPLESLSAYELFCMTQEENPEMAEAEFLSLKVIERIAVRFYEAGAQVLEDDALIHRTLTPAITGHMTKGDYATAFGSLYGRVAVLRQYLGSLVQVIEQTVPELRSASSIGASPTVLITLKTEDIGPDDHPSGEWRQA